MNKNYNWKDSYLPCLLRNFLFCTGMVPIKKAILFSLFLIVGSLSNLYADGSKDMYPVGATGNRAFLYSNSYTGPLGTTSNSWPFKTLGTHYVYAKVGETIATGSSAQGVGNGRIILTAPNGTQYISDNNIIGQIPDRNGELAGPRFPTQGAGGNRYVPYNVTVAPGQTGIWKIEFSPTGSEISTSTPGVTDIAADASWSQNTNSELISAWDVSVRNTTNTDWISGRVYTTIFNLHIQGTTFTSAKAFYSKFFVLTKDGVAYKVTNKGSNGVGFTFFVNNKGFLDASGNPSYNSLDFSNSSNAGFKVYDPRSTDDTNNVTHKIFYTTPALDLPATAKQAINTTESVTTWLKNSVVTPTATNITYTGVEGTVNLSGNKGGYIGFDSNLAGTYRIEIDLGNLIPTRTITGNSIAGTNAILWDGKDGAGNVLPPGTNIGEIRVQLFGAEVHFPFIDLEINPSGIIIEQLDTNYNLYSPTKDLVYWDDSTVSGGNNNTKPNPIASGLLGISSNSNGHKWGRYIATSSGSGNNGDGGSSFGNEKSLDTWSFVPGDVIIKTLNIVIAAADLEVKSIAASVATITIGESLNYTVIAKNNGPSDVSGAGFAFNVPAGFAIATVTYVNSQGVIVVTNGVIDPITGNYKALLDMPNGSEITFTITGAVTTSFVGQSLDTEATIIRPADVTDIDATNPGTLTPLDPHLECKNGTNNEVCNNIKYNALTVNPIADLSIAKSVDNNNPFIGSNVTFTLTATNAGPNIATDVTATDLLPTGYSFLGATTSNGSFNSGTGKWLIGTLSSSATATLEIKVTVNPKGNYLNTASVYANETDPNMLNNQDTETVTLKRSKLITNPMIYQKVK